MRIEKFELMLPQEIESFVSIHGRRELLRAKTGDRSAR
jgi:hypothetical protein